LSQHLFIAGRICPFAGIVSIFTILLGAKFVRTTSTIYQRDERKLLPQHFNIGPTFVRSESQLSHAILKKILELFVGDDM